MEENVFDVLQERGFIAQTTHDEQLRELLGKEKVKFYIGFDATADSLTVGHFLTVMAMMHMQQHGHTPIALIGGGTTMIGDPSGRSDMRTMMTRETIDYNANRFKEQLSQFIDFDNDKAIMVNNADWLLDLNYVTFLREVGVHFSVNRMLTAECYKQRMEKGLTFFEFNYMLMQAYDFYVMNQKYGCKVEMGGDDQWSNILAGADLIRRKKIEESPNGEIPAKDPAFGLTFTLLTTSDGKKMGKTMKGAVWLDPKKTTPYEFYQYWRNIEDANVEKCLGLLTFLPMDEVRRLGALEGAEINKAKEVLAYEITKTVHGEEEAKKAQEAARTVFASGGVSENMPSITYTKAQFDEGIDLISVLVDTKLSSGRGDARRTIEQGGVKINDEKVADIARKLIEDDVKDGAIIIRKGKKSVYKIEIKGE
ncbi:MAG: tyrosine--tRNA ligase [Lachnospiraceae bacterium]|nr:tyrosine--tRNA ligase [Lachnospiraceae bacterium]